MRRMLLVTLTGVTLTSGVGTLAFGSTAGAAVVRSGAKPGVKSGAKPGVKSGAKPGAAASASRARAAARHDAVGGTRRPHGRTGPSPARQERTPTAAAAVPVPAVPGPAGTTPANCADRRARLGRFVYLRGFDTAKMNQYFAQEVKRFDVSVSRLKAKGDKVWHVRRHIARFERGVGRYDAGSATLVQQVSALTPGICAVSPRQIAQDWTAIDAANQSIRMRHKHLSAHIAFIKAALAALRH